MPEMPDPKARPHPWSRTECAPAASPLSSPTGATTLAYVELAVTTNFTFLSGASHPEEFVEQAALLGHPAAAICDLHTVGGVVRAHVAAKEARIPLVVGARVRLDAGPSASTEPTGADHHPSLMLFPSSRLGYASLCRLLTLGKRRAAKGECRVGLHDVLEHQTDMLCIMVPPRDQAALDEHLVETVRGLESVFNDDRLSIAAMCPYGPDDETLLNQIAALCRLTGVPMVATNDVHYHVAERRELHDVLTCVKLGRTIDQAGRYLLSNAERHLKSAEEMSRLLAQHRHAIARTVDIARRALGAWWSAPDASGGEQADRCQRDPRPRSGFNLDQLRYEYPDEVIPPGKTAIQWLAELTWKGAQERFGSMPGAVRDRLHHELRLIEELNYAHYFLTVHDIVVFARGRGILCQGRGAAANSAVCYCLGITAVDPQRIDLLFERFVSKERNEPPDIDIDFEHERREEVIQYIYAKYGRERAALTAEIISYRGRSAIRDVGKALGLSLDLVDRLAKNLEWWEKGVIPVDRLREMGLNPGDATISRVLRLADELLGFPRHRSQHVGGFVITRGLLSESVPIENAAMEDRTVIEWDKDDIDAMGMLKVDVLGLGMLTCISKALVMVNQWSEAHGQDPGRGVLAPLQFHTIPPEDPAVYDMVCKADTVGVFQIESRAQMTMLPRLRPRCYYDLVIEVAIVRPGPIVGQMVHPYLRRRNNEENFAYPSKDVRDVLEKTMGVPIFQEQAMRLAIVAAGFTPGEADQLRRAMAAWKRKGDLLLRFESRFVSGMLTKGYKRDFAQRCFEQLKGFSEYGFPESHAASFALIVYASAWLKRRHPAAFAAALINSQPMGFYAPAQIVRDAQDHGVTVLPVDVNRSAWDCTLERCPTPTPSELPALRLGLRLVSGLKEEEARRIELAVRSHGEFMSVRSLRRISGVKVSTLRRLAGADAFGSMNLDRQHALWQVRDLRDERLEIFESDESSASDVGEAIGLRLPRMPAPLQTALDYSSIGLSLKSHPVSFVRDELKRRGVIENGALRQVDESGVERCPHKSHAAVAGIVLIRQRPSTANGVVFMTIEDETGIANLILRPEIYKKYRRAARHSVVVLARGRVERLGDIVHVNVSSVEDVGQELRDLATIQPGSRDFH